MKKIIACGFHCIKIKDLGVSFGEQQVLENINLHIHCGQISAVIGRNGAGKSTLVKAILDEVPHTGEILFKNKMDNTIQGLRIGYVPQTVNIDRTTPLSVYDMFQSFTGKLPILVKTKNEHEHVKAALAEFDVDGLIDQPVGTLSGGQLQRVLLAMAVHDTPNLLLLDEPVSGIDKNGMDDFYEKMQYLKETHDLAIILVSHDLDYVYKYADNVILIDKTVTAAGKPKQVFESEAFKRVFGKGATGEVEVNANV
ncbi:metal ABC transporter ATP-binding protein [Pseudobutyrivibrio sp.]|uniref:metal ABC transporter ATP-binding protein n=1 Tax=Pseudobutyrivibrio sp. TaxID=2014367 RepID=UPI001B2531B8|nr:metal ABC transporter ATP-binding protein [Pseudobutyrivibrio sp.]MBO5616725.1 metal ABC transporter ATP-binding protein [Pseudobutyrivibrio sp.]MBP3262891.1 metal ABC transporter ATP-binding protein [Pseudobutyrivibrio sp.]